MLNLISYLHICEREKKSKNIPLSWKTVFLKPRMRNGAWLHTVKGGGGGYFKGTIQTCPDVLTWSQSLKKLLNSVGTTLSMVYYIICDNICVRACVHWYNMAGRQ